MKTLSNIEQWKLDSILKLTDRWNTIDNHEGNPKYDNFRSMDILEMQMLEAQLKVLLNN